MAARRFPDEHDANPGATPLLSPAQDLSLLRDKAPKIDYKDVKLLQRYVSERGKMVPSRITAVSAKKQREPPGRSSARGFLGLLPYLIQ